MKKLTKEQVKQIEDLGWVFNDSMTSINQATPAGEDYWIEANNQEELINNIKCEYENFDIDEHVEMWLEAKRNGVSGVPSAVELVDDAKEIDSMLEKLYDIVNV